MDNGRNIGGLFQRTRKRRGVCGICGKAIHRGGPVDPGLLYGMCEVMKHRGPDDEGVWVSRFPGPRDGPWFGLGHRRLSIIDLSCAAKQPMCNEDGSVWMTFNGEIYNFAQLREWLLKKGHMFRSRSDAEVILHLYEEEGEELLGRLRGMFAFGVVDTVRGRLLLARDRLGQKPLAYARIGNDILFSSEPKALLMDPRVERGVNLKAIAHYLALQYIPAPMSAFSGIEKLPPAHYLVWEEGTVELRRYWSPQPVSFAMSLQKALERTREMLGESVSLRMVADVPVGAFLSGGLDSSAIVAMMSQASDRAVPTLTVRFGSEAMDEGPFARDVARAFGTDHGEILIEEAPLRDVQRISRILDEPFADPAFLPTYRISEAMRRKVKVALSGEGGDEVFGGYGRYRAVRWYGVYERLPERMRRLLIPRLVERLPIKGWARHHWMHRIRLFISPNEKSLPGRYARWVGHFSSPEMEEVCTEEFLAGVHGADPEQWMESILSSWPDADPVQAAMFLDMMTYLPNDLLQKVDMASMACGLEVRCPFLDHPLVEYALGIPSQWKAGWMKGKIILRMALGNVVPRSVLHRSKVGFTPPIDRWLRGELSEMTKDLLTDATARSRGYFKPQRVEGILREHNEGTRNRHYHIWNLLMLELWHRNYVDTN